MSEESVEFFCHIFLNLISPNTKKRLRSDVLKISFYFIFHWLFSPRQFSSLVLGFLTAEISGQTSLTPSISIKSEQLWMCSSFDYALIDLLFERMTLSKLVPFLVEFYSQKSAWRSAGASGGGMRASMRKTHVQKSKCTLICLKCPFLWLFTAPPPSPPSLPLSEWFSLSFRSKTQSPTD